MKIRRILSAILPVFIAFCSFAQKKNTVVINTSQPIANVSSTMWGVFFEDINFGADGGIYAELIKNRSFEFAKPLMGWAKQGKKIAEGDILVLNRQGANESNPRFLRVNVRNASKGEVGITNEGFKGMGIKKDLRYDFSVMYRQATKDIKIHVELIDASNKILGSTSFVPGISSNQWEKQTVSLTAIQTSSKAKLNIWFEGNGIIDLDMISLFPSDTWKGRSGGMRNDMVQMLADMKPGFIRFPGGCIVEGIDLANRYQWKKTIGPLEERQLIMNRWNVEFANRPAPDYFQTFGLGFFEYFQLAEDIGAAPLPILNCGMACQYNTAELVPIDQLDPYIQDALDLVEFANGDENTVWGKKRIEMGHAAPFNLKYLGVGNENWGPQYIERAKLFQIALKKKYPTIQLIFSSGTDPDSERFRFLDKELRGMKSDIIDEHYYRAPEWFLKNASRYDSYDRNGPKVFAGEYAAHVDGKILGSNRNIWQAAIAEAAFMTGLERNAGVVSMASYAPLFANAESWQWAPDMIWTDNLNVYGTPNYFVQKIFSTNKGTHVLSAQLNGKVINGTDSLYASAVIDSAKKEIIFKIVNTAVSAKKQSLMFEGSKKIISNASIIRITGALQDKNSFDSPNLVAPKEEKVSIKGKEIALELPANSLIVLKVGYK